MEGMFTKGQRSGKEESSGCTGQREAAVQAPCTIALGLDLAFWLLLLLSRAARGITSLACSCNPGLPALVGLLRYQINSLRLPPSKAL